MKSLAILPAYNEEQNIGNVLSKFSPGIVDEVVVVNDGSTDKTADTIRRLRATVIDHAQRQGVGSCIRDGINYAIKNRFDVVVVMAGNGKDDPAEIPRLLEQVSRDGFDYVQGSRYLSGGRRENTPFSRLVTTTLCTMAWSVLTFRHLTDASNGFRAYRTSLFRDKRIDISQPWLDRYELEYYIHYKVLTLGYRFKEVSVSKNYPSKKNYTKIRPWDWWGIVKPLIYLRFGIKK